MFIFFEALCPRNGQFLSWEDKLTMAKPRPAYENPRDASFTSFSLRLQSGNSLPCAASALRTPSWSNYFFSRFKCSEEQKAVASSLFPLSCLLQGRAPETTEVGRYVGVVCF